MTKAGNLNKGDFVNWKNNPVIVVEKEFFIMERPVSMNMWCLTRIIEHYRKSLLFVKKEEKQYGIRHLF